MYKIIRNILIVAVAMLCSTVCVYANAEYSISGAMITKYNANEDVVVVPSVIDGVVIAGIDENAFQNKDMHTVIIEEGIEVIQSKAFVGCSNLKYVKSPESMLLINENAFFECYSLCQLDVSDETYVMNDAPVSLLSEAETESENYNDFLYSGNTITGYVGEDTDITIPESINGVKITTIAASAFTDNTAITSVIIPDTVTTIGGYAFKGCTSLEEVSLTKKLSSAGVEVFMGCSSLKSITIPGTLKRVSKNMFYGCNALTNVVLESGVNRVGPYTFYNCTSLENVEVPETITMLEPWCFGYCKKLKTFYIPNGCTLVDSAAFYYCNVLNNIQIPDTVTTVGTHCFRECWALTDITLSKAQTGILQRAFHNCAFSKIEIPDSVTKIEKEAFFQCKQLKDIEVPSTVKTIGIGAFYGCSALNKLIIYGTDTTPDKLFVYNGGTSIGEDTLLYVVAGSVPEQAAKDNAMPYISISGTANVVQPHYFINNAESEPDNKTELVKCDSVSVKYTVINVGDREQDLCLMICLYDEKGSFLGVSYTPDSVGINKFKEIEADIEINDDIKVSDKYYAKVMLFDSFDGLVPLYTAKEI